MAHSWTSTSTPGPISSADLDHILQHTPGLWDELRGQHLFITGGTGFFGTWLLESLLYANQKFNLGLHAVVLTRNSAELRKRKPHLFTHSELKFHEGDIRSFEFPQGPFSHIIHAATPASASLNVDHPLLMLDTIVTGTRRVLEFSKHGGAKRLLFTSSGAVYGKQPSDLTHIPEDYQGSPDPMNPRSAYGEGKHFAEHLCALEHAKSGLEIKIARCFAFVGPHLPLDTHFAIGNFIQDGLNGQTIQVGGDGTPFRSYLYAADLMIWLWTILFKGDACRPYNVGSDQAISIGELAKQVAHLSGVEVKIAKKPAPNQPVERYVPSTKRAFSELGLKTRIPLKESLERTLLWHQYNRSLKE